MDKSTMEQKVRCLNCFMRIPVPLKAERLTCPKCEVEYVITWRGPQAKIVATAKSPCPGWTQKEGE